MQQRDRMKNISILTIKRDFKSTEFQGAANSAKEFSYLASFATRVVRRATFRAPVFLCSTPFDTPRMISGSAAVNAAWAAGLSPRLNVSSTLRVTPRRRVLRAVLKVASLAAVRTRFLGVAILCMVFMRVFRRRAYSAGRREGQTPYGSPNFGFRFSLNAAMTTF